LSIVAVVDDASAERSLLILIQRRKAVRFADVDHTSL